MIKICQVSIAVQKAKDPTQLQAGPPSAVPGMPPTFQPPLPGQPPMQRPPTAATGKRKDYAMFELECKVHLLLLTPSRNNLGSC